MRNLILKLEYDGTNYHGWQRQDNAITIQGVLEKSIQKLTCEDITVIGCSRTDARVHARGFICNFNTNSTIPTERVPYALNSILPYDVVALDCLEANEDFHARYCAVGKKYRYRIINRTFPSAFHKNYAYHWPYALDIDIMKEAAKYFIGEHDFKAFMASGSAVKSTVRQIYNMAVEKHEDEIIIDVSGNGFLYNMVRIIVGTILYVGNGKLQLNQVPRIIQQRDRKNAGVTAPPQGLYLMEVYYTDN